MCNTANGLKANIFEDDLIEQIKRLNNGEMISSDEIDNRLVNTGICIQGFVDEDAVVQDLITHTLTNDYTSLRLIILPTRECNLRCVYCYENKRAEYMHDETVRNLIEAIKIYIVEKHIKSLVIEWFGGEPLLSYELIIKISAELMSFCNDNYIDYSVLMTTNGYLLDKQRAEELLKYNLFSYQITIDGDRKFHDRLRVKKDGGATWDVIYNNLLKLKDIKSDRLDITIRINYHIEMLETIETCK